MGVKDVRKAVKVTAKEAKKKAVKDDIRIAVKGCIKLLRYQDLEDVKEPVKKHIKHLRYQGLD